jgi:hypothetical protein
MFMDTVEGQAFLALPRVWERVHEKPRRWGTIDPETDGFLCKDASVQRTTNKIGLKSYLQKEFCPTPSAHLGGPNARILGSHQLSL